VSGDRLSDAVAGLPALPALEPLVVSEGERLPRISVVMASAFQRAESLERCLGALRAVEYPDFEVIVVDNRRVAQPVSVEGMKVLHEPRPGVSAARNRGLAEASGELVAFTDDDVEVDPMWLLAIALRLRAHPEEVGVTGLILPAELQTPAQLAFEDYYDGFGGPRPPVPVSHHLRQPRRRGLDLRSPTVDAVDDRGLVHTSFSLYATGSLGAGANMAFRADPLRRLGGFDEALPHGQDLNLFARLVWRGHSLGFEPAALVRHIHRADDGGLRHQIEGFGVGYAAMITSLIFDDPRHLGGMLGTVPRALQSMTRDYRRKLDTAPVNEGNRELAQMELRGMLRGPFAFLRWRSRKP
jgi:glycosyltransferase involved in cell wall biosynthesis